MSFSSRQLGLFTATCLSVAVMHGLPVASQTSNQNSSPNSSQTSLSPRFSPDPQIYNSVTSGSTPLSALASAQNSKGRCQGFATDKPNYKIRLKEPFGFLSLKVFSGGGEIVLLVKGFDGTYCRDEPNPELSGAWPAGEYQIWVGSKSGDRTQYRLSISETRQ
jgi:hypothetical protein